MLEASFIPRKIGVEVEAVCGYLGRGGNNEVQQSLAHLFQANGLTAEARGYGHSDVSTDLAVETDGSLNFQDCPFRGVSVASLEIKTRILNDQLDFKNVVPKMMEIGKFAGLRVNSSTGFHCHVSIPEIANNPRIIKSLYNLIFKYQNVLYGLTAQSRITSRYCQPLPSPPRALRGCRTRRTFCRTLANLERYRIVNFEHIGEDLPRVEFRLWGGTLNPTKALNYVRIGCALVDHAVRRSVQAVASPLPNDRKSLESLLVSTGFKVNSGIYSTVSPDMRETGKWMLYRWFELNGRHPLKPKSEGESISRVLSPVVNED